MEQSQWWDAVLETRWPHAGRRFIPCILISLLSGFTTRITNLYLCLLLQHMNISLCFTTGGCHEVRLPVFLLLLLLVWIDKCNRGTLVYHERSWRVLYLISLHWSKNYDLFTANAANSLLVGLWRSRTIKLPSTKGQQMARETMTKDTELLKMIWTVSSSVSLKLGAKLKR